MNTSVSSVTYFQAECASLVVSFAPDYAKEQSECSAAASYPVVRRSRNRHLNLVGTPIDEAFGRIDVLWKLDKRALERMATDPATPVIVLERLATHPCGAVRAAVAENENTPLYTVWALAKDADADVRYQLAENHNLPLTLIRTMTNDENPYVACRAQKTLDRLSVQ